MNTSRALEVGSVITHILADYKEFEKGFQKSLKIAEKAGQQLQAIGKKATMFLTVPLTGAGFAAVKAASDAEETASKFSVVFSSIIDDADNMANELDKSYGLSVKASKQLLSDTGDLLAGFGFTQEAALDLSIQVQRLAVDLASFTNYSGGAAGASQALTKALLGERESVKLLGIAIVEEDVNAKVLEMQKQGLVFATERQAKAYATLQIAMDQSKNAIGDYARTTDSLANQTRELMSDLDDLAVELGTILIPVAKYIVASLKDWIEYFRELSPETQKLTIYIGGFLAVIGPLALAINGILMAGKGLLIVYGSLSVVFTMLSKILFTTSVNASEMAGVLSFVAVSTNAAAVAQTRYNLALMQGQSIITPYIASQKLLTTSALDVFNKQSANLAVLNSTNKEYTEMADTITKKTLPVIKSMWQKTKDYLSMNMLQLSSWKKIGVDAFLAVKNIILLGLIPALSNVHHYFILLSRYVVTTLAPLLMNPATWGVVAIGTFIYWVKKSVDELNVLYDKIEKGNKEIQRMEREIAKAKEERKKKEETAAQNQFMQDTYQAQLEEYNKQQTDKEEEQRKQTLYQIAANNIQASIDAANTPKNSTMSFSDLISNVKTKFQDAKKKAEDIFKTAYEQYKKEEELKKQQLANTLQNAQMQKSLLAENMERQRGLEEQANRTEFKQIDIAKMAIPGQMNSFAKEDKVKAVGVETRLDKMINLLRQQLENPNQSVMV